MDVNLLVKAMLQSNKFYQEYMMEVQSEDDSVWTRKNIKHWKGHYEYKDGHSYVIKDRQEIPINVFIGCDPATDIDTKTADFSVIMVIGI